MSSIKVGHQGGKMARKTDNLPGKIFCRCPLLEGNEASVFQEEKLWVYVIYSNFQIYKFTIWCNLELEFGSRASLEF